MPVEQSLKNLRIADLELFVTVAKLSNLGKAASLHHLSQSAASAAIRRIEAALGFNICTHERRHFRLERDGEQIVAHVENWLRTIREAISKRNISPIRISTTHAIAQVFIPCILSIETIELSLSRPDLSYGGLLRNEIDIALVPDNARWEGVIVDQVARGSFQLYSSQNEASLGPVLLPEDQLEVLTLQQRWRYLYGNPIPIKARIPSWSLIADICRNSNEIGFLPDFLAQQHHLHPVSWQPEPSVYRILALYRDSGEHFKERLQKLLFTWMHVQKSDS